MNNLYHPNFIKLLNKFPLLLDARNPKHVIVFRRTLEWCMTKGLWSGFMAEVS